MIQKASELHIDSDEPFKNDVLGRASCADTLTRILEPVRQPLVLAINSAFGTGKTTFIRMWRAQLAKQEYTTLYFNAWENDFTENALISLLGEFRSAVKTTSGTKKGSFMDAAQKAGAVMLKHGLPVAAKAAVAAIPGGSAAIDAISEITEKIVEDRIEHYEKDKQTLDTFRTELAKFVQQKSPGKPVIFFVDELDRCRPLFAIEVLEHAKHLFNVDGLVFILSLDKDQLGCSLQAVYGNGMDTEGYLRRFIDLEYRLPQPDIKSFVQALAEKFDFDSLAPHFGEHQKGWQSTLSGTLTIMANALDLRLRDIEQITSHLLLAVRLMPKCRFDISMVTVLVCLRAKNRKLLADYLEGRAQLGDVLTKIAIMKRDLMETEYYVAKWLGVALKTFPLSPEAQKSYIAERDARMKDGKLSAEERDDARYEANLAHDIMNLTRGKPVLLRAIELAGAFVSMENA